MIIMKKEVNVELARSICKKVTELCETYGVDFFFVTPGASATRNKGSDAVRNAREAHIQWELKNNNDPYEDWRK